MNDRCGGISCDIEVKQWAPPLIMGKPVRVKKYSEEFMKTSDKIFASHLIES